jgi:hypothetical protein
LDDRSISADGSTTGLLLLAVAGGGLKLLYPDTCGILTDSKLYGTVGLGELDAVDSDRFLVVLGNPVGE